MNEKKKAPAKPNRPAIYLSPKAWETVDLLRGKDRGSVPDARERGDGWYTLPLAARYGKGEGPLFAPVPPAAVLVDPPAGAVTVDTPIGLGPVIAGSRNLPEGFEAGLAHWAPPRQISDQGVVYYQNKSTEYFFDLEAAGEEANIGVISEGIVHRVRGLAKLAAKAATSPHLSLIRVRLPLPQGEDLTIGMDYGPADVDHQDVFLLPEDILSAPDPNCLFIEATAPELTDYGYFY